MKIKLGTVRLLDDTYRLGLIIKALDGFIEVVGGLVLLLISSATLTGFVGLVTRNELSQDPHDFIASSLVALDHRLTGKTQLFVAAYLLGYGIVKLGLAVELLRNRHWAYKPAMALLSLFLIYQIYQIGYTHSLFLLGLSVLDAIILALVVWEYRRAMAGKALPDHDL